MSQANAETKVVTLKDAYEMGRYVTRHQGSRAARDRIAAVEEARATVQDRRYAVCLHDAYLLGRDRLARTGEH